MIYLAGFFITTFLFVVLVSKKGKSIADKILAVWLFFTGVHLLLFYLFIAKDFTNFPYLLGIEKGLPLIHGPFLYIYTLSLTSANNIKAKNYLHFAPVIFIYVLLIPFFLLPAEQKIYVYKHQGAGYEWFIDILLPSIMISGVVYIALCFYLLRRHKKNIENQFSDTEKINLNWMRYLIYGTSIIWIIVLLNLGDNYIYTAVVLYVFFIGYFGIKQVGIFSNAILQHNKSSIHNANTNKGFSSEGMIIQQDSIISSPENDIASEEKINISSKTKYKKSSLTDENAKQIHHSLTRLMKEEKLFKDAELTLGELSQKLNVHPNILSQVINSFLNKNFYDYINGLRVEEFIKLVQQPESKKYTLLSLSFECGFNSKTAFNRNFKKATGFSPTEYFSKSAIELQ